MTAMERWCSHAVSYIRFPPDRPAVKQELLEHIQDKYDEYVQQGMILADAEEKVVSEMGDARETGLLLRKIHKPYLGWFWRVTQLVLAIALILAFVTVGMWSDALNINDGAPMVYPEDLYERAAAEAAGGGEEGVLYLEPNCSDSSDGYTFTVTKVAAWDGIYIQESDTWDKGGFYFLLEVANPRPWAGYTNVPRWFHAVDSLGNHYYSSCEANGRNDELEIVGNGSRTGLFTYTWHMWINNYSSQDADWLELYYDRDGRDVRLRIDLTGGEGA